MGELSRRLVVVTDCIPDEDLADVLRGEADLFFGRFRWKSVPISSTSSLVQRLLWSRASSIVDSDFTIKIARALALVPSAKEKSPKALFIPIIVLDASQTKGAVLVLTVDVE